MRRKSFKAYWLFLTILLFVPLVSVCAQADLKQSEPATSPSNKPARAPFSVRVTTENVLAISISADNAKLSEVAADLSRKLKIPVALSPVMQRQVVKLDFSELLLEPSMQLLAPCVYIDYEVQSMPGAQPRPLGIFLFAFNEIPPAIDAVVKRNSQSFVVQGNTEDNGEPDEDDPIQIRYKNGNISVKAKDQQLVDVVAEMASEVNVPFEAPESFKEVVTVDVKDAPLDRAFLAISPSLEVFVRHDLYRATATVLRVVVVDRKKNP